MHARHRYAYMLPSAIQGRALVLSALCSACLSIVKQVIKCVIVTCCAKLCAIVCCCSVETKLYLRTARWCKNGSSVRSTATAHTYVDITLIGNRAVPPLCLQHCISWACKRSILVLLLI